MTEAVNLTKPTTRKRAAPKKAAEAKRDFKPPAGSRPVEAREKLGFEIMDSVSGFKGIAIARIEMPGGNIQYAIGPQSADAATLPQGHFIDYHCLLWVGPGVSDRTPPEDATVTLKAGDKVRDRFSGFKGTLADKTTFMNGCVYFTAERTSRRLGVVDAVRESHLRWELYRPWWQRLLAALTPKWATPAPVKVAIAAAPVVAPEPVAKPKQVKPASRPPGGPSSALAPLNRL